MNNNENHDVSDIVPFIPSGSESRGTVSGPESRGAIVKPQPRQSLVTMRTGTLDDFDFIDTLQKMHTKEVGWMPSSQLKTYIEKGDVLVAMRGMARLGYIISRDTYFKHEDIGIIYQVNVQPDRQRGLIGASLVREVFHRSPYGVKLFCCWCAQDLDANYFWESLGFIPLAFRTGSARKKGEERIHIFWQRRVREGDAGPGATPYWFPSRTTGGAMREDRLVLPIQPGTHWSDAKPIVIPGVARLLEAEDNDSGRNRKRKKPRRNNDPGDQHLWREQQNQSGGLTFDPNDIPPEPPESSEPPERSERPGKSPGKSLEGQSADNHCSDNADEVQPKKSRSKKKKPKQRFNPAYIAAARELRDHFLEQAEKDPELVGGILGVTSPEGGKYDIGRNLQEAPSVQQLPGATEGEGSSPGVSKLDAA